MANELTNNPLRIDTAATAIASAELVQAIQWLDDDSAPAQIGNGGQLIMTINGITTQIYIGTVASQLNGAIAYEAQLPEPVLVKSLIVDTISGGTLYIWKA